MLDSWRLAVGTLTALPTPPPRQVDRRTAGAAMLLAPLAVMPLGVLVVGVLFAGHRLHLPSLVVALLAVGVLSVGNRAFHLDGLSDTVDGLAASYDRERSLRVMKSGTSGPAGVVATVVVLGLQAASLAALPWSWRGAALGGAVVCASRCALVLCCVTGVVSARPGGLGDTYTQTVPRLAAIGVWVIVAVALAALGDVAGLSWWRGAVAVVLAATIVLALVRHAVRRLGGVTGDIFGAAIEVALATLLVALS